ELRVPGCPIDVRHGDNVEWISFRVGASHVFCYAYYIQPPPTSGTIIVRKEITAPATTAPVTFPFEGDISFNPDRSFAIRAGVGAPGSVTFYRAGGRSWSFKEIVPVGWTLRTPSCSSATHGSTFAVDSPAVTVD